MSEEGRNPFADRDAAAATKGADDSSRSDGSADETQVLKIGDDGEKRSGAPGPLAPPAPAAGVEPAPVLSPEPFRPPSSDSDEAKAAGVSSPVASKVEGSPSPVDSDVKWNPAKVKATKEPQPLEPPVSAQPSVDSLRPKRPAGSSLRSDALITEDTSDRDRQINQLRVFAGAALAIAVIALIIGLGAGGGQSTVDTDHIADSAVTNPKIAAGAVTADKLASDVVTEGKQGEPGPAGPRGPIGHIGKQGPAGAPGISGVQTVTGHSSMDTEPTKTVTVSCPKGKSLLYGGAELTGAFADVGLQSSGPAGDGSDAWTAQAAAFTSTVTTGGAAKGAAPPAADPGDWGVTVTATCANFAKPQSSKKPGLKAGDGETVTPLPNTTAPPSAQPKH